MGRARFVAATVVAFPLWEQLGRNSPVDAEQLRHTSHPTQLVENVMDVITLLIQLVSGALGGNIAGGLLKNLSLGTLGNTIAGIVGGGLGGQILGTLLNLPTVGGGPLDLPAILTQIASGGVGGGVLMAIIGMLRGVIAK